jgi:WD40 repeat protein
VGTNSYAGLEQFETKFENDMRKVLARFVPEGVAGSRAVSKSWTGGSPFRGLLHFDFEHAPIFFGRTRAIDEVLAALKKQAVEERAFVLVFGGSGVGKSSLVRAGVLPWLVKPGVIDGIALWRRAVMRPSEVNDGDLFDALSTALMRPEGLPEIGSDGTSVDALAAALREKPDSVGMLIKGALSQAARDLQVSEKLEKQPRALFALAIDQLEELFTVERLASQREGFLRAIDALARSGYVWVLATLRSDFYPRCEESPLLMKLKEGTGQYHLQPPDEVQLGQMIRLPASAAGLLFEEDHKTGERLDDFLRDAAVKSPAALPLLEFALEELYEQRDQDKNLLKLDAYRALGGVEGALGKRAEESFQQAGASAQESFDPVFRQLVTISAGEGEPAVRRRARKAEVESTTGAAELVDRLTADRLLVADRTEEGVIVIGLAHEAMLASWPRLAQWVERNRESLKVRAQVAADAARWIENKRNPDYLYDTGLPLEKARVAQQEGFLDASEKEFVEMSGRKAAALASRRVRVLRRWLAAVGLFAVIAVGTGALALRKKREADTQKLSAQGAREKAVAATERANEMLRTAARSDRLIAVDHISKGRTRDGFAYLARACEYALAAGEPAASLPAEVAVLALNTWQTMIPSMFLGDQTSRIWSAQFSPDGRRIVSSYDGQGMRIWEVATGKLLRTLPVQGNDRIVAAWSPDGRRVVASSGGVWDVESGRLLATLGKGESNFDRARFYSPRFSPDGKRILSDWQATVHVWDAETGNLLATLKGHEKTIMSTNWSPDGLLILTGAEDATARLWESANGKALHILRGHGGTVNGAQFSPEAKRVVTSSEDKTARVWDVESGKQLTVFQGQDIIRSAEFSPDGGKIVTASKDQMATVWNATTGAPLVFLKGHQSWVLSAQFSPDGKRILTGSFDETARVWETATGKLLGIMQGGGWVRYPQWSPDGERVVTTAGDDIARIWELPRAPLVLTLKHEGPLPKELRRAADAQFSPDGQQIITAAQDKIAHVWETESGKMLATLEGHEAWITTVQFSPDQRRIVTASEDKTARLWDAASGRTLATLGHEDEVSDALFNVGGEEIATFSLDKTARLWDAANGSLRTTLRGHGDAIVSAQFSPDGSRLATASKDKTARLWDATEGKLLTTLQGHTAALSTVHWSPDGQRLVTASQDKTIRVWNPQDGRQLLSIITNQLWGVVSAQFSPEGRHIVSATFTAVQLWNAADGTLLHALEAGPANPRSARFSADGERVVAALGTEMPGVWERASGKLLGTPRGHGGTVNSAQFSQNGERILTSAWDKTARVWETLGTSAPPPSWFPKFLRWVSGRQLLDNGDLANLTSAQMLELKSQAQEACAGDTSRYGDIARCFLMPREQRLVRPGGKLTANQTADVLLHPGAVRNEVERAYELWGTHPLVHIALAAFEQAPELANQPEGERQAARQAAASRADFLRRYSLERLPADSAICRRAAEMLRAQNQAQLAQIAEEKGAGK